MSYLLAYNPYNTNLFMRSRSIDPAAQDFIDAAGITGDVQQQAINNLVKGLKADGLWSKMKAVYPFVTDNRNLASYTNTLTQASYWDKVGITLTSGQTDPTGGTNATRIVGTGVSALYALISLTAGATYTLSCYVKSTSGSNQTFRIYANGGSPFSPNLTATSTWQQVTLTFTAIAGNNSFGITRDSSTNNFDILAYGIQMEAGSTATTYQPIATTQQAFISSQFKFNLVNPVDSDAAFRLVFNGGWTHSSNGATPNGTNGYANTYLNPVTALTNYNAHASIYNRLQGNNTGFELGNTNTDTPQYFREFLLATYRSGKSISGFYDFTNVNAEIQVNSTSGQGFFNNAITSNTNQKLYKNGTQIGSNTNLNSSTPANTNVFIGAVNAGSAAEYNFNQYSFSSIGEGLTDTEAANLYTRVQAFNQALSRQVGVPIVSDADAQAFLNSAEITDITQANAINTLVTDLKAQGLWTKMKAIYPFVGGTASTHKYNLKDPRDLDAAYRLVFNGGWTHSSTGATPNGTNGYADTKLNQAGNLTPSNNHISFYSRTDFNGSTGFSPMDCGITNNTSYSFQIISPRSTNLALYENGSQTMSVANTNSQGLFLGSSTNSTSAKLYKNGSSIASSTTLQARTMFNNNIYLGAANVSTSNSAVYFSPRQQAFASIGDGLNDTEATALYNAVNNYQVALSRNI